MAWTREQMAQRAAQELQDGKGELRPLRDPEDEE